jgi:hypothetical protein
MITEITVTNHLNESLTMELASPSGLAILYIEGLGPVKTDIALTDRAGLDGAVYNSARGEPRNIVISLKFMPTPNVETNRQLSYKYFPLKRRIKFAIKAGNREAYVYGYVESNEPNIFSNESSCIISILCPNSYLYDVLEQITVFSSVNAVFEFPFSNESLVTPLLEMSELIVETEKTIVYEGDAPIGMLIHIHANGAANNVTITKSDTLETLAIDSTKLAALTGSDIVEGDDFYISTLNGNKYATLIRSSVEWNILNCLGTNPTWFQLEKGDNVFAYTALSGLANLEFKVTNDVAYEGI